MKWSNLPITAGKLTQKSFIGLALGWKERKKKEKPRVKLCQRKKGKVYNLQFYNYKLTIFSHSIAVCLNIGDQGQML
jgi:hypothetical protein